MVKHVYAISVEKENMERLKEIISKYHGSTSAVIDELITEWLIKNDPKYKLKKEEGKK